MVKCISKKMAKKMIDEAPGDTIMILTYDNEIGLSIGNEIAYKAKGKKLVNSAEILMLNNSDFFDTIMLHGIKNILAQPTDVISKSILLSKM